VAIGLKLACISLDRATFPYACILDPEQSGIVSSIHGRVSKIFSEQLPWPRRVQAFWLPWSVESKECGSGVMMLSLLARGATQAGT
jgi:hypothetical protein